MSLKNRRFSLDSSISLEGFGLGRRSSNGKYKKPSQSLDGTRLEIQELNRRSSLRDQIIVEGNLDRPDGLITKSSFLKQNITFHKLFQDIPEGEKLTHKFSCALQKEVLYHGKLFVSENYVCFYSSVLLKDTKVVIPASSVREVKKRKPALSMLTIFTVDREKYMFVSLRKREMCYELLQSICSQGQGDSANSSPHASSVENEVEQDRISSYSSLEDSVEQGQSRNNSVCLESDFPYLFNEAKRNSTERVPGRCSSQSSMTYEEDTAGLWIWSITERVASFFFLREIRSLSVIFYIYMMLTVLFLLVSGYIGLRIIALEEELNSLGALNELPFHHTEYKET